ncbi:MAG TPA: DUF3261 domain-containing protein [Janthinobacterium sp.]|nr:DUF3261 domain-containing protein [Janthinobacterium sp.]
MQMKIMMPRPAPKAEGRRPAALWAARLPALLPLLLSALLAGCATRAAAPPAPARLGLQLAPDQLGATIAVQQHLHVERDGRGDDLDVALEVDASHLELVGLAYGQRVLTLHYDGRELSSWRHPMLPEQVRAADVLEDLQLTLWPAAAIRLALPAGWSIEESGLRRTLYLDGAAVALIDYSGAPRWSGTVVLDNLRYRYRLTIQTAR